MSANDVSGNLAEAETQRLSWQKQDRVWMLSLYGTAIGAGTLFLPINAGLSGIWPLIIMAVLAFPMTYFSHQALCRFVLSGASSKEDITDVVMEHFGRTPGKILTFFYFFAIYPILLLYSVAITNTMESFIVNQLGMQAPSRVVLSIGLILALMIIVRLGQDIIVKAMSLLVYPFVTILIGLSLMLIPHWNNAIFQHKVSVVGGQGGHGLLMTMWLLIPVMVFSFNHTPIISSFAMAQKREYGSDAEKKCSRILKYSHLMMVVTVMFFVFSCVLSLSPQDLHKAKQQNISILSYLANHFQTPLIAYIAPIIAFIAIAKSFLGHYLGASEGLQGLISAHLKASSQASSQRLRYLIDGFIILTCWMAATINPSILGMIETLGGPVIALILLLMPMYAIWTVPAMKPYRRPLSNGFIVFMGIVTISAIFYGFF